MSKLEDAPLALRIVTIALAGLTLVHFTIWTLICIIGGGFEQPWWLWIALPPGVLVGCAWAWYLRGSPDDD